ncbi:hypothetical protein AYO21_02637 [Fonsecaea monophora]|uniref:Uncharacterized protein n=1 Tax=Fonsecaea monophora TaxID=254056 RepID=A0A177FFP4_9EURO|nr:hypothetical protein AYO21_02637 [Fonsecaea monophora]OAG43018.1 hypothetical protein AYO21_02637 [Fonsecaea monophora]
MARLGLVGPTTPRISLVVAGSEASPSKKNFNGSKLVVVVADVQPLPAGVSVQAIPRKISQWLFDVQAEKEEVRREEAVLYTVRDKSEDLHICNRPARTSFKIKRITSTRVGVFAAISSAVAAPVIWESISPSSERNAVQVTDSDLYFHFLNHTCRTAPSWQKDRIVLQVGIAKLALESELVSHSVLALSATCLCCDTISAGRSADPETVRHILDMGLEHHTLALEQMRTMTSRPRESDTQPLIASSLMLVPFALAFQHIQHWVLRAKGARTTDLLTPRDMILLLRGIRTTIVALNSNPVEPGTSKSKSPWETMFSAAAQSAGDAATDSPTIPERSHTMFPVVGATFHQASSQLRCRIECALAGPQVDENMAAVYGAYEILSDIMTSTFTECPETEIPFEYASCWQKFSVSPDSLLAQAPGWLHNFILQRPNPTHAEPLARSFLAFFSSAPQTYVDLLLPLLDPHADMNAVAGDEYGDEDRELTTAEILALDVYAHWLVLMLLLEKETWWVGEFPFVSLQGLIARYGAAFLGGGTRQEQQQQQQWWWPAGMLEVAARVRQWK